MSEGKFIYFDGEGNTEVDRGVIDTRIREWGHTLLDQMKVATSPSRDAPVHLERACETIRSIFSLRPPELGGLNCFETVRLLHTFMRPG